MKTLIPGNSEFPVGFKACVPFFIASVVYHADWLEKNLFRKHPYFSSVYIRSFNAKLAGKAQLSIVGESMIATGIAPWVNLSLKTDKLEQEIAGLKKLGFFRTVSTT